MLNMGPNLAARERKAKRRRAAALSPPAAPAKTRAMDPADIFERTENLRVLLNERLRARGETLGDALTSARRQLPRRVRREAAYLTEAETLGQHPRLARQVDPARFDRAETELRRHLRYINRGAWLRGKALTIGGILAFNILLFGGLAVWWLRANGRI